MKAYCLSAEHEVETQRRLQTPGDERTRKYNKVLAKERLTTKGLIIRIV